MVVYTTIDIMFELFPWTNNQRHACTRPQYCWQTCSVLVQIYVTAIVFVAVLMVIILIFNKWLSVSIRVSVYNSGYRTITQIMIQMKGTSYLVLFC